ncbi:MAG: carboxypeptidase-like regulatory domain-containing protein [Candidatus Thermoplasmatota archaeon]|nr:carboxypeptidase-like regulatory domain-containing protein [Candidatus Thermoplasmatota archaeon]
MKDGSKIYVWNFFPPYKHGSSGADTNYNYLGTSPTALSKTFNDVPSDYSIVDGDGDGIPKITVYTQDITVSSLGVISYSDKKAMFNGPLNFPDFDDADYNYPIPYDTLGKLSPTGDYDGDGQSNSAEVSVGTSPFDASDYGKTRDWCFAQNQHAEGGYEGDAPTEPFWYLVFAAEYGLNYLVYPSDTDGDGTPEVLWYADATTQTRKGINLPAIDIFPYHTGVWFPVENSLVINDVDSDGFPTFSFDTAELVISDLQGNYHFEGPKTESAGDPDDADPNSPIDYETFYYFADLGMQFANDTTTMLLDVAYEQLRLANDTRDAVLGLGYYLLNEANMTIEDAAVTFNQILADVLVLANKCGPFADYDGDGMDNQAEVVYGYDPLNPDPHPSKTVTYANGESFGPSPIYGGKTARFIYLYDAYVSRANVAYFIYKDGNTLWLADPTTMNRRGFNLDEVGQFPIHTGVFLPKGVSDISSTDADGDGFPAISMKTYELVIDDASGQYSFQGEKTEQAGDPDDNDEYNPMDPGKVDTLAAIAEAARSAIFDFAYTVSNDTVELLGNLPNYTFAVVNTTFRVLESVVNVSYYADLVDGASKLAYDDAMSLLSLCEWYVTAVYNETPTTINETADTIMAIYSDTGGTAINRTELVLFLAQTMIIYAGDTIDSLSSDKVVQDATKAFADSLDSLTKSAADSIKSLQSSSDRLTKCTVVLHVSDKDTESPVKGAAVKIFKRGEADSKIVVAQGTTDDLGKYTAKLDANGEYQFTVSIDKYETHADSIITSAPGQTQNYYIYLVPTPIEEQAANWFSAAFSNLDPNTGILFLVVGFAFVILVVKKRR